MKFKNILAFSLGPVVSAVFGLLTLPVIAWSFSAEDVGRLNILQLTVSFCLLLFVLGLDQAYVRSFHESSEHPRLLKSCFSPGFFLLIIGSGIGITFGEYFSVLLFEKSNPILVWIAVACVVAEFTSRFLSLVLRMQERGLAFSISQIIPKAFLLIAIYAVILLDVRRDFYVMELAALASTTAMLLVCIWSARNDIGPALLAKIDRNELRELLEFGAPLIISGLAYWGLLATSSLALRFFSTFAELGVYSVAMSFAGVATVMQSIFSVVWAPIVYKWVAEGKSLSRIDGIARQVLAVVCGVFVFCGSLSWLTDFILPSQYHQVKYLILCAIVQPLLYTLSEITCVGIGISRRTMLSIWVTLAALLSNIILSLLLVPSHGAAGAVIANALTFGVFFVARTEASAFVWRQFPRSELYIFVAFTIALSILTVLWGPALGFLYTWVWLLLAPLMIFYFRDEIMKIRGMNLI